MPAPKGNTYRKTHGMSGTPAHYTWVGMRYRCTDPESSRWEDYGGRGIKVCSRWLESFENFFEDMGERPAGKTLDRIDGDGDYAPANCRWATKEEQANNKSNTRWLEYEGIRLPVQLWAAQLGIRARTLLQRIDRDGRTVHDALTLPVSQSRRGRVHGAREARTRTN